MVIFLFEFYVLQERFYYFIVVLSHTILTIKRIQIDYIDAENMYIAVKLNLQQLQCNCLI